MNPFKMKALVEVPDGHGWVEVEIVLVGGSEPYFGVVLVGDSGRDCSDAGVAVIRRMTLGFEEAGLPIEVMNRKTRDCSGFQRDLDHEPDRIRVPFMQKTNVKKKQRKKSSRK